MGVPPQLWPGKHLQFCKRQIALVLDQNIYISVSSPIRYCADVAPPPSPPLSYLIKFCMPSHFDEILPLPLDS